MPNIKEKENILLLTIWLIFIIFVLFIIINRQKQDNQNTTINIKMSDELELLFHSPKINILEKNLITIVLLPQPQYLKVLNLKKKKVQFNYVIETKSGRKETGFTHCFLGSQNTRCELEINKPSNESIETITLYLDNTMP